jgi:hypothetical protein
MAFTWEVILENESELGNSIKRARDDLKNSNI